MRSPEATTLTRRQIDFENSSIVVLGKGNKQRPIPMTALLSEAMKLHKETKCIEKWNNGFVFPSRIAGKPLTDIRRGIEFAKLHAQITKRITPHMLRH